MKFYFVYEHAFPLGFGLSAILFFSVGIWGVFARRALILPFVVTYLTYLGILTPLFLLSLNHFLEAWPLDWGTIFLNGIGVIIPPIWLIFLWRSRFELTAIGVAPESLRSFLEKENPSTKSPIPFRKFPGGLVCYLGIPSSAGADFSSLVRTQVTQQGTPSLLLTYSLAIVAGAICLLTAAISWCSATLCIATMNI